MYPELKLGVVACRPCGADLYLKIAPKVRRSTNDEDLSSAIMPMSMVRTNVYDLHWLRYAADHFACLRRFHQKDTGQLKGESEDRDSHALSSTVCSFLWMDAAYTFQSFL